MRSRSPIPVMLMARELGPGGSERQLTEVARHLDRSRFSPHVCCFHDGLRTAELREAGVPILKLPMRAFLSFQTLKWANVLGRYLDEHKIEIVHAFDYPLICFGLPVARAFRTPVVLSSQRSNRALLSRPYRALVRLTDYLVDGVVVNCEEVRRHLVMDERVNPRLIHLCYNGIDTERFQVLPRRRPEGADFVIGVVCGLRPEKGLETLLHGFAQVCHERPGMLLLIVGSGTMLPCLEDLAVSLGIAAQCRFQPFTSAVAPWLHAMDIFVLPSLSEAFSNSIMEAMACGCAVIASRVGGNPELVQQGHTGILFEKADAADLASGLRLLIHNEALRERLVEVASARIRDEFSMTASARRMGEIYDYFLQRA